MLEQVLQALGDGDEYVSGEAISQLLGKSRTTVWQLISTLKSKGYAIEASTKKGYRLVARPDRLYAWEVVPRLKTDWIGRHFEYREKVTSTNDIAKELAQAGASDGLVVAADEQSRGRGRRGRGWSSPFGGGIYMSIVLRPDVSPREVPKIALVAALGVAEGIEAATGLQTAVKWPNDVLVDGKKVCGILVEMEAELEAVRHVVVGIGVNANVSVDDIPEEARERASSLSILRGSPIDRVQLTAEILLAVERQYVRWIQDGFQTILPMLKSKTASLGVPLVVIDGHRTFEAEGVDISDDGALLVRQSDGKIVPVYAADVSIRNA